MAFSTLPLASFAQTHSHPFSHFSIYLKRKPTLKRKHTSRAVRACSRCGLTTEQISVLVLWILSLGETGFLHRSDLDSKFRKLDIRYDL